MFRLPFRTGPTDGNVTRRWLLGFAYLRLPLVLAGVAFLIGASDALRFRDWRAP
jgi:hypothetical protein